MLLGIGLAGLVLRSWSLVAGSLAGFATILLLPVGWCLLHPLEDRFPAAALPGRVDGIIVLGGAVDTDIAAARGLPALNQAAERMTAFVALARRYPDARLAFTGGRNSLLAGGLAEADIARQLFTQLGVTQPVVYEDRSRNTDENARFLHDLIRPAPDAHWVLITSAGHMPRAMGLFRAAGWPVLPWPVAYGTGPVRDEWSKALPKRLSQLDGATHEWFGLIEARLLGRTDRLLPAP